MECVAGGGAAFSERPELAAQGYRRFRCRNCGKQHEAVRDWETKRTPVRRGRLR
jgi:hypothetical protein